MYFRKKGIDIQIFYNYVYDLFESKISNYIGQMVIYLWYIIQYNWYYSSIVYQIG